MNRKLSQFVLDHDSRNALLIIYYAGHACRGDTPGELRLTGSVFLPRAPHFPILKFQNRTISMPTSESEMHEVVWNSAETLIKDTQGDVLVIFDCSLAAELEHSIRLPPQQHAFEFMAPSARTTRKPGPRSFTAALIHSLQELAKEGGFSTQELLRKIDNAPDFPEDQHPRLHERHASGRKIIMSALTQESIISARRANSSNDDEDCSTLSAISRWEYDTFSSNAGDYLGEASTLPSSAFESNTNDKNLNQILDHVHGEPVSVTETHGFDDDTATIYSFVTDSSAETGEEGYEAYFGFELFSRISSLRPEEGDIRHLTSTLPKLLQSFTRRLGSENSAQIYRDIMRYVHKHRT